MDFVVGLPTTQKGHESIWVIIDRLTKSAYFIPVNVKYRPHQYAKLYIDQIVRLHGVLKSIVSEGPSLLIIFGNTYTST